jgi:tetraacyldisaccharide 4'-kinase
MNLKKPKFWDHNKPNIFAYFLYPFALLIKLLNFLNSKKNKKKVKIKTICVGNIYLGGTGKTSLSIKINELLKKRNIKSCFIKKFYKNQFDEQKLLENKGKLFLSTRRLNAILKAEEAGYEVAILDDGLQDYSIDYDIRFVCFNNINWKGNGMTIPAGPLREDFINIKKYENIFLNGNLENLNDIKKEILDINPNINIHIGKYEVLNLEEFNKEDNFLVFSGIGNHKTFIEMLKNYGLSIIKDIEFSDHHSYTNKEIDKIIENAVTLNCKVITTEKDYFRLESKNKNKINYIKSNLKIIDEDKLLKTII